MHSLAYSGYRHGSSTTEHPDLSRDDTQYLLALAIADGALLHIKSVQDLWQFQIPEGSDELPMLWADHKKNLPVLRKADMTHGVTEEALPAAKFDAIIKSVWHQAGYFKDVTVHCIRRALGKAVNGTYSSNISGHIRQLPSLTTLSPHQPGKPSSLTID